MVSPRHGEVWWAELPEKRRPVLVLSHQEAIDAGVRGMIAIPITSRIRNLPSEANLDEDDGLSRPCVAAVDGILTVHRAFLTERMTVLGPEAMQRVCAAL